MKEEVLKRKLEDVADEHAVDFAEWLMKECYYQYNNKWLYRNNEETYNTKELIRIYKYSEL